MNDITERLRSLYVQHGTDYVQEAADEIERLRAELDAITELNHAQYLALENVRCLAARNRNEDWACHMLRFVERAGTNKAQITRGQVEIGPHHDEIERLRAELAKQQSLTRAGLDLVEIQQRRTEKEITCLTAERDRALDRVAAMEGLREQEPMVTKRKSGLILHAGWDPLPVGAKLYAAPMPPSVDAHELWAAAQLTPGEGIEDGVGRITALLMASQEPERKK